jgi:hypothetical protein
VAVVIAYLLPPVGREVSISESASTYLGTLRVVRGDVSVSNLPGGVKHYVADLGQHGQIHRDLEAFVTDCKGNTHRHRGRGREESLQGRRQKTEAMPVRLRCEKAWPRTVECMATLVLCKSNL